MKIHSVQLPGKSISVAASAQLLRVAATHAEGTHGYALAFIELVSTLPLLS